MAGHSQEPNKARGFNAIGIGFRAGGDRRTLVLDLWWLGIFQTRRSSPSKIDQFPCGKIGLAGLVDGVDDNQAGDANG